MDTCFLEGGRWDVQEGYALHRQEQLGCMQFCYGMCDGLVRSLWARIRGKAKTGNIVVGICYGPPGEEDKIDEDFSRQVEEVSLFQALAFIGYTDWPEICWAGNTVGHKQFRFPEGVRGNFLTQVLDRLSREMLWLICYSQTRKKWLGLWWSMTALERPRGGRI